VDLTHDAVVVFWPSLYISARRRLRAENRDPDVVELIQAVQLAGRIRPYAGRKIVVFADARFDKHRDYLQRLFDVQDLRLPQ